MRGYVWGLHSQLAVLISAPRNTASTAFACVACALRPMSSCLKVIKLLLTPVNGYAGHRELPGDEESLQCAVAQQARTELGEM